MGINPLLRAILQIRKALIWLLECVYILGIDKAFCLNTCSKEMLVVLNNYQHVDRSAFRLPKSPTVNM